MPIGHCPMPIAAVYIQAIHGGGQWGTSRMGWDASSILWSYYHISQYKFYHISQHKFSYYKRMKRAILWLAQHYTIFLCYLDLTRTSIPYNHSGDLTIKRETGQHLQVLRYLIFCIFTSCTLYLFFILSIFVFCATFLINAPIEDIRALECNIKKL